jgi:predicted GIY-YIG superfamily endonuclease
MYYTYILRSIKTPGAIYIGYTSDLNCRLEQHNSSHNNGYTKRYAPWSIESYVAFSDEEDAKRFEVYLKSSSGKAFMRKRLISNQFKEVLVEFNTGRRKISESSEVYPHKISEAKRS